MRLSCKAFFIFIFLLTGIFTPLLALDVELESYPFYDPQSKQKYVEVYLRVHGSSVVFDKVDAGLMQAGVHVTLTVEQGSNIVAFEKYTLRSPQQARAVDFIDVKRFVVEPGSYYIHLVAIDANDADNKVEFKTLIEVEPPSSPHISGIMVLGNVSKAADGATSPFVKQGIYMEPLSYSFLADTLQQMTFYTEVYAAPPGSYIKYGLYNAGSSSKAEVAKYKKLAGEAVQPFLLYLPIDELLTGNYEVTVELFDSSKQLLSTSSSPVSRRNVAYDQQYWSSYNSTEGTGSFVDSVAGADLRYDLLSLIPVAKEPLLSSLGTVIDLRNESAQRQFLFKYWKQQAPEYPGLAYKSYRQVADLVHEMYDNNVGFGFQTDRGHIFLKYGKPNKSLSIDTEPDAPPYEIWYYSKIEGGTSRQTDVRFIFYNPSLSANDYQLLHSTCIGERNNPAWEVELYRDAAPESQIGNTIDATKVEDGWNRRAIEYFNDF